jgi:hypothetical protein
MQYYSIIVTFLIIKTLNRCSDRIKNMVEKSTDNLENMEMAQNFKTSFKEHSRG